MLDLATAESLGTVIDGTGSLAEMDGEPAWLLPSDGTLRVFDLSGSGFRVRTLPAGGRNLTTAVVDGRPLAVVDDLENVLTLRDVSTGAVVGSPMAGHVAAISRLGVTPRSTAARCWCPRPWTTPSGCGTCRSGRPAANPSP